LSNVDVEIIIAAFWYARAGLYLYQMLQMREIVPGYALT
jgi:hypothetical protein